MTSSNAACHNYFDIAVNATDEIFRGIYRGKAKHADDFPEVLARSAAAGCKQWLVTGTDLADSLKAHTLCLQHPDRLISTAGIHPTQSKTWRDFEQGPEACMNQLATLIQQDKQAGFNRIRAFGEFGLDYDRLDWSPKETQLACFKAQLEEAVKLDLPLFLHSRAAAEDFSAILGSYADRLPRRGVVHSFTGSLQEMQALCADGWSIGLNGCSLKTEENLAVAKAIPLDKLMLETDAPWCEIRPSHAGTPLLSQLDVDGEAVPSLTEEVKKPEKFEMGKRVRGRNEPCGIVQVAFIIAKLKGVSLATVAQAAYENSVRMFGSC